MGLNGLECIRPSKLDGLGWIKGIIASPFSYGNEILRGYWVHLACTCCRRWSKAPNSTENRDWA